MNRFVLWDTCYINFIINVSGLKWVIHFEGHGRCGEGGGEFSEGDQWTETPDRTE